MSTIHGDQRVSALLQAKTKQVGEQMSRVGFLPGGADEVMMTLIAHVRVYAIVLAGTVSSEREFRQKVEATKELLLEEGLPAYADAARIRRDLAEAAERGIEALAEAIVRVFGHPEGK